jgi:FkbM family methyltransferase
MRIPNKETRAVGTLLHAIGVLSRSTPYFRGKWRLWEWVFHKYFKRTNKVETVCLGNHIRMECNLSDELQFAFWCCGNAFELKENRWLQSWIKPGMVFFDVGANVGYYSLLLSPLLGPTGSAHGFEPVSQQCERFRRNIELSGLINIVVNREIVSDSAGEKVIHVGTDDNSGTASVALIPRPDDITETVPATTLDQYFARRGLTRVDVIKIDVQGHELAVLRGGEQLLRRHRPVLLVEIHSPSLLESGSNKEEIYHYLETLGFEAFSVLRSGELKKILAPQDGVLIIFKPSPARVD